MKKENEGGGNRKGETQNEEGMGGRVRWRWETG